MTMIKVNDVSMRFLMANDNISSIKEFVTAFLKRKLKFKEFWALEMCIRDRGMILSSDPGLYRKRNQGP